MAIRRLSAVACILAVTGLCAAFANRNDGKHPPHSHKIIEVVGEPIIKKVDVTLDRPRRIAVDRTGNKYVVDSTAGTLTRIDQAGKATVLAKGLDEPSGLCLDNKGHCYVANHAHGEEKKGTVIRVDAAGKVTTLAKDFTGPKGIAIAKNGTLYVALFGEDRIVTLSPKGLVKEFCRNVGTPAALCFDAKGNLLATNSLAGTVTKITPKGQAKVLCKDLQVPSDIAVSPEGDIVVANYTGTRLTRIHPDGKTDDYLKVPEGTIALCFVRTGNLLIANWDLQLMIHVRNRLAIPCPHCNKKIPVRIKPRNLPAKTQKVI